MSDYFCDYCEGSIELSKVDAHLQKHILEERTKALDTQHSQEVEKLNTGHAFKPTTLVEKIIAKKVPEGFNRLVECPHCQKRMGKKTINSHIFYRHLSVECSVCGWRMRKEKLHFHMSYRHYSKYNSPGLKRI